MSSGSQAGGSGKRKAFLVRIFIILLLLPTVWFFASFAYVSVGAETDHARQADVILTLGCKVTEGGGPSRCISARASHAADLYKRGLSGWIIVTGGETETGPAESVVLRIELEKRGVPPAAIVEESRAHNTIQNIRYSAQIMRERGWTTAILVTEPYHINRAALIARDYGLEVYPSPAVGSPNWSNWGSRAYNLSRDTLSLMLYRIKSLVGVRE